jgi:hypothetical protein
MSPPNPYNYNLPLGPNMFFGRDADIVYLTENLTAPIGDSFALIGGRRMGKTSLLEALVHALESHAEDQSQAIFPIVVLLDLTGEHFESVSEFLILVAERAREKHPDLFDDAALETLAVKSRNAPAPTFANLLRSTGHTIIAQRGRRFRLIILLDECEQLIDNPCASQLYAVLRYLLNGEPTRSLIKVVMTGSHRFLTLVRQRGSPLPNILTHYRLRVLSVEATREMINRPTGGCLGDDVVQSVVELTGGHPFLTQYVMHHVWEVGLNGVTVEIVLQIGDRFIHERDDFQSWIEGLGVTGPLIYHALVNFGMVANEQHFRETLQPCPVDLIQALESLSYHGVIARDGDGHNYRIVGKMFMDWFVANVVPNIGRSVEEEDRGSLQRQLDVAIEDLQIVEEHKERYVMQVEVPLQLIKEERRLQLRIAELRRRLGLAVADSGR